MACTASEAASIILLMTRWRSLLDQGPPRRITELRVEAQRCFRLAQSIASFELAEELETIGCSLELEAKEMAAKMQAAAYQICFPGLSHSTLKTSSLYQQLVSSRLI
jgi:hypothetical protein